MKKPPPQIGYNSNYLHNGVMHHVQTEDSGVDHPHVITHVYVDGGRIVATKKTSYAKFADTDQMADGVRKLMKQQHKAMLVSLRNGEFDNPEPAPPRRPRGLRQMIAEEEDAPLSDEDMFILCLDDVILTSLFGES